MHDEAPGGRRRWTASEKVRIVEETFEPGMTVSLVARRYGVAPNQLFKWRRLVAQGDSSAHSNPCLVMVLEFATIWPPLKPNQEI